MRGVLHFLIGLTVIFCIECKVKQDAIDGAIVNSKVDRKIDVSTHLVKMSTSITLENTGKSPIKSFLYALEPSLQNYLSIITANVKDKDEKLGVSQTTVASKKDLSFWRIELPSNLEPGKTMTVDVDSSYAHALTPYPAEITQSQKQQYKSTKDANTFAATRKKVDADYKSLTQQISDLQTKLKNEGSDLAEKVNELQVSDRQYKDLVALAITLAEKLVSGKINKQQYLDNEKINKTKREDLDSKMEALRSSLA
uniref:Dolichyl-diphosphooligosaccharide--protein glycosyltransferase subunit 1 n=1 Tax=Magallana gigas TaxID=29159 RepID=A0A8W8LS34_MAGGI